jgi:hypothetical protein
MFHDCIGGSTFSYVTANYVLCSTIAFVLDLKQVDSSVALVTLADALQLVLVSQAAQLSQPPRAPRSPGVGVGLIFRPPSGIAHTVLYLAVGYAIPHIHPSPDLAISVWGTINFIVTVYMFFRDMWG